jgi:hypothetical protein
MSNKIYNHKLARKYIEIARIWFCESVEDFYSVWFMVLLLKTDYRDHWSLKKSHHSISAYSIDVLVFYLQTKSHQANMFSLTLLQYVASYNIVKLSRSVLMVGFSFGG